MRVLYVIPNGGVGTGSAAHLRLAREAVGQGATAALFASRAIQDLTDMSRTFVIGEAWRRLGRRLPLLRKAVAEFQPDVVHVFRHPTCEVYPLICRAGLRATWLVDARTPILQTGLRGAAFRVTARGAAFSYDRLAAHTDVVGRKLFGPRAITVLPPGFNEATFRPGPLDRGARGGGLRLVYIGTLDPRRGLGDGLAEIVRALPAGAPKLSIDIYGAGDDRSRIEKLNEQAPGVVRIMGHLPQDVLAERLRDYDVGLALVPNPIYRDAPPLKTIEFLASGLPVIATDSPGNRTFVADGVNGWLVGAGARSMADVIASLLGDGVPDAMRAAAAPSVNAYAWSEIVRTRLLPLYEDCLRERRRVALG